MRARRAPGRAGGAALGVVLTALLTLGVSAGPASAAPRPSDSEIQQAQAAADAAADQVRALSAELSDAQEAVAKAQAASAIALDGYQAEQAEFQAAQAAAGQAAAAAARAAADLQASRDALAAFARRSFMSHSTYPGAEALVSAGSPAELVERAALLDAAGAHRTDEVGRFTAVRQQADRADAAARSSLARAGTLRQQAAAALGVAQDAERAARRTAADVTAQQAELQHELDQAKARLVALIGAQQAADRLARQQATAPPPAGSTADPVDRTEAGPGSASAARTAIRAAKANLGTAYSWGGGGSAGPGYGIEPDRGVLGFDCSGLTQYAYARAGIDIPRNSRAQYAGLPKVAKADLQPGDLVFWATDPQDPSTIHHVALYLGGGTVIQAPESGDVVKISPMWWTGYAGAVRPSAR